MGQMARTLVEQNRRVNPETEIKMQGGSEEF
jgi:hypothetical protein